MTKLSILSMILLILTSSISTAEDVPPPYPYTFGKGMVCTEVAGIELAMTRIAIGDSDQRPPKGCFMLRSRIRVLVEPMHWYETSDGFGLVAKVTPAGDDPRYMMIEHIYKEKDVTIITEGEDA